MNNLLRTLANSQAKLSIPDADFKRLLQVVKDSRQKQPHDAKLVDPFYDALEDLLHDLRSVTMDNHDADAFIKPVSRVDVPDYYDYITNPMDFQTMLKKVKQKQYKSKKDFKDDLDLIWSNCFQYNATENHPLRLCAARLKAKAEHLLKYITDRKERADPSVPVDISVPMSGRRAPSHPPAKLNGINGHVHTLSSLPSRPPSSNDSRTVRRLTPALTPPRRVRGQSFEESPAIVRTAEGMAAILELERSLDAVLSVPGPSRHAEALDELLRSYIGESDSDADGEADSDGEGIALDGATGDKRKLNGICDSRISKRPRLSVPPASDTIELWWDAQSSDAFIANTLPPLPSLAASGPAPHVPPPKSQNQPASHAKTKKRKKRPPKPPSPRPRSLLAMMNANISTQRRLRRTHAKFVAISAAAAAANSGGGEDGEGGDPPTAGPPAGTASDIDGLDDTEADAVDERPWPVPRLSRKSVLEGTVDVKADIGELATEKCIQWVNRKILEHVGFQGSSQLALDVLSGITVEYLSNVGRTFRFYLDKYSNMMTSEEIILHSLFESGVSRIQGLEKYITDDVVRHGNRLNELEKKITNVYQEFTSTEAIDDEALFANEDDEEEESAFVMGQFTDDIGEDFLGLRELGIAAEFGLSSLSIPKRLLKGKRNAKGPNAATKSAEPPPPYPPPQPFVSLTSESVKSQVGLLRGYFEHRLASAGLDALPDDPPNPTQAKLGPLGQVIRPSSAAMAAAAGSKKKTKPKDAAAATSASATATMAPASAPALGAVGTSTATAVTGVAAGVMTGVVASVVQPTTAVLSSAGLVSPLGAAASTVTSATSTVAGVISAGELQAQAQTPKKKKATPGVGTGGTGTGGTAAGTGGVSGGGGPSKKRGRPPEGLPPVVVASA
ncbi:hypothetical protein F5148DRAFT_1202423 [Russula earlei]|uniref:Uncharacterized protein n=1 Tax=Russula earlei TaxID=71964 RepID=A0ACC0UA76_9AGAM|nr:hypothetical protein F5148DRAFT_1202423 [Russula earlei]